MDGSQVMRQVMRKTGSVVRSAAVGLALAAIALTVMAGCARVSTEHVEMSTARLPRPELILVHDYQQNLRSPRRNNRRSKQVAQSLLSRGSTSFRLTFSRCCYTPPTPPLVGTIRHAHISAEHSSYVPRAGRVRQRIFWHSVKEIITLCFSRATPHLSAFSSAPQSRAPWCREPTGREQQGTPWEG